MHPLLLALPIVLAALAGCSGTPEAAPATAPEPCLVTSAEDMGCAEEDANLTALQRPHLHDYWQGQERVVLQDVEATVTPFLCVDVGTVALLRPADRDTLLQGASQVEATLEWDPQGPADPAGAPELWVKTAADSQPSLVKAIESGETVVLSSDNNRNDLPHQRLSAWEFHFAMRPDNPTGCFRYQGTVRLHLEIVRGLDIPLYPGHLDRWGGAQSLPLVDETLSVFYFEGSLTGTCLGGPNGGDCLWEPTIPADGAIVPYDAATVVVTLTAIGSSPLRVHLAHHGADTRELVRPDASQDDGTTRVWRIPVATAGDGPYARQSQWEFWFEPDAATGHYSGDFHVNAVTERA